MLNKQIVQGRMTADPELRHTATDVPLCSFTIASQDDRPDANGDRSTDFVDCVAWRGTAEFISRNCKKGRLIIVEGRPRTRTYKDKNDVTHKVTELDVKNVYLTDRAPGDAEKPTTADGQDAPPPTDDDLPF